MDEIVCRKCGSQDFKEGKVGYGFHAYVTEDVSSTLVKSGKRSKLLTTFCLNCGEVQSFRVEKPLTFKK